MKDKNYATFFQMAEWVRDSHLTKGSVQALLTKNAAQHNVGKRSGPERAKGKEAGKQASKAFYDREWLQVLKDALKNWKALPAP